VKSPTFLLGIIGFLLALYGLISSIFFESSIWYSFFVIGGTLFLAWINKKKDNPSLFKKSVKEIVATYLIYLAFTILIEIVGRILLNLWYYPKFNNLDILIHVFLIGYPFGLFFVGETINMTHHLKINIVIKLTLLTIINAFLNEIPNIFSWEWVYTIPYVTFEILKINIVVIVGWIILIAIPIFTESFLKKFHS